MPRNGDQFHAFRQNSDLFYLTGIEQEQTFLLLCPDYPDPTLRQVLFIRKVDKRTEIYEGKKLTDNEARQISGVEHTKPAAEFNSVLGQVAGFAETIFLNLNEQASNQAEHRFVNQIKSRFPLHQFKRLAPLMRELRLVKSLTELQQIQKAIEITNKGFRRVLNFLEPGKTEFEVEAELTHEFVRQRADGHAFAPIVASGGNACYLHYVKNTSLCNDGELLLMDFGAEYANYAADCSRTIPVNGKFSPRQRQIYEAVWRVEKQAEKLLVPGTTIDEFHRKVCDLIEPEMVKLGLIKKEQVEKQKPGTPLKERAFYPYMIHGTSHFMGLDVHDTGSRFRTLQKGMVLTCEPGIYIPDENIGVRIENDILVDEIPVNLSAALPDHPDEIEEIMAK